MGIGAELSRAGNDLFGTAKQAGSEILHSKTAPEMAAEVLLVQPAKVALNVFGISMRTALRISGILAWEGAKTAGKALSMLPILPFGTGRNAGGYERMAREAPITL
jgi:hypothetical protein